MLDLAAQRLQSAGVLDGRVALHHGTMQSALAGSFDGATCLLTFHFVPREERVPMVAEIRRRLKPGAPLVVARLGVAQEPAARAQDEIAVELVVLTPEEAILREAGFATCGCFIWVCVSGAC